MGNANTKASGKATTRAFRAVATSLGECAERLPAHTGPSLRLGGSRGNTPRHVLVVTDSGAALEDALVAWCVEVAGARRVTVVRPRKTQEGTWSATVKASPSTGVAAASPRLYGGGSGGGGGSSGDEIGGGSGDDDAPADVCIFRVEREFEDTVAALRAAISARPAGGDDDSVEAPPPPPLLRLGAWVVGQVKLGRRARHHTKPQTLNPEP